MLPLPTEHLSRLPRFVPINRTRAACLGRLVGGPKASLSSFRWRQGFHFNRRGKLDFDTEHLGDTIAVAYPLRHRRRVVQDNTDFSGMITIECPGHHVEAPVEGDTGP